MKYTLIFLFSIAPLMSHAQSDVREMNRANWSQMDTLQSSTVQDDQVSGAWNMDSIKAWSARANKKSHVSSWSLVWKEFFPNKEERARRKRVLYEAAMARRKWLNSLTPEQRAYYEIIQDAMRDMRNRAIYGPYVY